MRTHYIGFKTVKEMTTGTKMYDAIKFTHEEVDALLKMFPDDQLSEAETSALAKLKKIFALQVLSYERKKRHAAADHNAGQSNS